MPAKSILDIFYNPAIEQEVKLGNTRYKHYVKGDWFILE